MQPRSLVRYAWIPAGGLGIMWGLRQQRGTYFIPPPFFMPQLEIYILSLAALFRSAYSPFQHFPRMHALHNCINLL